MRFEAAKEKLEDSDGGNARGLRKNREGEGGGKVGGEEGEEGGGRRLRTIAQLLLPALRFLDCGF